MVRLAFVLVGMEVGALVGFSVSGPVATLLGPEVVGLGLAVSLAGWTLAGGIAGILLTIPAFQNRCRRLLGMTRRRRPELVMTGGTNALRRRR